MPSYQPFSNPEQSLLGEALHKAPPPSETTLVVGPPGSGKTALGVQRARRLTSEGWTVTYLCFSRLAANQVKASLGDQSASTLHAWLWREWKTHLGLPVPQVAPFDIDWDECLSLRSHFPRAEPATHAVLDFHVLDLPTQAYEFLASRFNSLTILLEEDDSISNRKLISSVSLATNAKGSLRLKQNLRTTQQIADFISQVSYRPTDPLTRPERQGEPVHILSEKSATGLVERAGARQVAILSPSRRGVQRAARLYGAQSLVGVSARRRTLESGIPKRAAMTIAAARGLEFEWVILFGLGSAVAARSNSPGNIDEPSLRFELVSAAMRTRDLLAITYSNENEKEYLEGLTEVNIADSSTSQRGAAPSSMSPTGSSSGSVDVDE